MRLNRKRRGDGAGETGGGEGLSMSASTGREEEEEVAWGRLAARWSTSPRCLFLQPLEVSSSFSFLSPILISYFTQPRRWMCPAMDVKRENSIHLFLSRWYASSYTAQILYSLCVAICMDLAVALIYYAQMCKIMPCDVVLLSPFPFIEPD
jgi:hypothetical protein